MNKHILMIVIFATIVAVGSFLLMGEEQLGGERDGLRSLLFFAAGVGLITMSVIRMRRLREERREEDEDEEDDDEEDED